MTSTQPAKFSRYRSVRKAISTDNTSTVPLTPTEEVGVSRAPSRYHRKVRPRTQDTQVPPPSSVYVTALPSSPPQKGYTNAHKSQSPTATTKHPPQSPAVATAARVRSPRDAQPEDYEDGPVRAYEVSRSPPLRHERTVSRTPSATTRPDTAASRSYEAAREEARMILEGEYDRLQKMKEVQARREKVVESEAPVLKVRPRAHTVTDNKAAEHDNAVARHDLARYVDAPKHIQKRPTPSEPRQMPSLKSGDQAPKPRALMGINNSLPAPQATFDAPVSAVNAGERRVEVRSNGATVGITLPVTPTTTARDLLNSASICMSDSFNPRSAILVESFSQVGLERPLRRYEHIRDVMNSWDMDTQNHLVVMAESECTATGLERKDAPTSQPGELMLQMNHSCRPGKWEKRWVVLRADGQVTISKHENDGDASNACHLSDFDVYTPTRKQTKQLRPPKRICFAVKSQQKSAMFLEGTNFVHFFATNDKEVADRWYRAVQSWRSWYLVSVLGEGGGQKDGKETYTIGGATDVRPSTAQSQETIPYQLGSFKPLLDFDMQFGESLDTGLLGSKDHGAAAPKKSLDLGNGRRSVDQRRSIDVGGDGLRRGSRQNKAPPSAFPGKLCSEARNNVDLGLDADEQAFTGTGLLARSASRRSQTGKTTGHGHGVNRGGGQGKPLVDLTEGSEFAAGSLLQKLEAWSVGASESEPRVDRQRRVEADIRVGEGFR